MITKVGKIQGTIAQKMSGKNGFGYDPIFIPKRYKITFGQMSYSKKIKIDHRYIAFKKLKKKLKTYKFIISDLCRFLNLGKPFLSLKLIVPILPLILVLKLKLLVDFISPFFFQA